MITAVVTSDNHLGVYYARLRPDRLEERRRALQHAFERVVDAAIERNADLFLHAGDLFDRPDPRNAERLFVARQMHRLHEAHIPIFAITGNHDSPRSYGYDGGVAPQEEMAALGAFRLFRNTDRLQAEVLKINGHQVCITGMSCDFNRPHDACPLEDVVADQQRRADIDIILLHYGVEGWARADVQEPTLSLANLERLDANAICVGHLHDRQQMRLPNGAVLLNPGATEHIHFGEEKLDCGFWVLHMEPGHTEAEYISLPPQPMRTCKLDITNWSTLLPSPPGPLSHAAGEGESLHDLNSITLFDETPENMSSGEASLDIETPLARSVEEAGECAAEGRPLEGVRADAFTQSLLTEIEAISDARQLLRVRLSGRVPRERFQELDLVTLQTQGNERNFYCQLEADDLTVYDHAEDILIGYGVSFDAGEELQHTAQAMLDNFGDDSEEKAICCLAGQEIAHAYDQFTKGAR